MSRQAEHVYIDQASLRQLEALIAKLPTHGHVVLVLKDGSSCDGVVSTRPDVRLFHDADAREGINAEVQLQRPDVPDWSRHVWLDLVARVEHVDSIMARNR
ncbi:MAG TPA: DUF3247 family protein [Rhodanobacter sp.]